MKKAVAAGIALLLAQVCAAAELRIGLIPEQNVFRQMERYEPLGAYLGQRAGVGVRFTILPRYGNIIDSFVAGELDGAFWGSFTGALAIEKLGIEPLVRPVWKDGTSTYHGYLFVRRDSGIRTVADMKGKTIVFVDRATTAGCLFPLAYLREHGVRDVAVFFREHYFAGSHDAAIAAVLDREADVGCAKNTIWNLVSKADPRIEAELVILAESAKVPSNGFGVRPGLPPELRARLQEAFLGMSRDPEGQRVLANFQALEFIETTREDYAPVYEAAARAGIVLSDYQYRNE